MEGTLGHFWTDLNDVYELDKSHDGYVRLVDGSLFHIDSLRTQRYIDEFGTNRERVPTSAVVYGMTGTTPSMFFDLAGVSQSNVMGQRASTQNTRMRGLVTRVPLDDIEEGRFTTVEMTIPEVTRWSGLIGVSEKVDRADDTGRAKSWEAKTRDVKPLEIKLHRNRKVVLSTTWSVEGPTDKRILSTPLEIGSISDRPLPWHEHVQALMAVQDLINLAYEGFVPAEKAAVHFKGTVTLFEIYSGAVDCGAMAMDQCWGVGVSGGSVERGSLTPDREALIYFGSPLGRAEPMPSWSKVRGDAAKGRQEPLGMPHRFKAFHRPFALSGGLMRVLGAIVQIPRLPVGHRPHELAVSNPVAGQFVGHQHTRYILQALE
jgi:hypothetical protein